MTPEPWRAGDAARVIRNFAACGIAGCEVCAAPVLGLEVVVQAAFERI